MMTMRPISAEESKNMADEELWGRIAPDGCDKVDAYLPETGQHFAFLVDEIAIGFIWFEYEQPECIKVHIGILKPYRKEFGLRAGRMFLDFVLDGMPEVLKVNAEIPDCNPDVCRFTEKLGFAHEGINRLSIKRAGKMVDQLRYGITREELSK